MEERQKEEEGREDKYEMKHGKCEEILKDVKEQIKVGIGKDEGTNHWKFNIDERLRYRRIFGRKIMFVLKLVKRTI